MRCPNNSFPPSVEHIRVYRLFPHPSSHNDPRPPARFSGEINVNSSVVIDFAKVRDQKNRGMLKTGAKEKAIEMWLFRGWWGRHRCSDTGWCWKRGLWEEGS